MKPTGTTLAAFALSLPDTDAATIYGSPAVKVASNGRAFVFAGPRGGLVRLAIDPDTKDDAARKPTPTPSGRRRITKAGRRVLVRYGSADPDRVTGDDRARARSGRGEQAARKPRKA